MIRDQKLRGALLRGSVLSSALFLAAVPQAEAGCVDTSERTICSNGSLVGQNVTNNIIFDPGNYIVELDNFQIQNGGVRAYWVQGNTNITLANDSKIFGATNLGVSAGVWVDNYFGGDISVGLLDTSSVSGLDGIFAISRRDVGVPGKIRISSEAGSILGTLGSGIRVFTDDAVLVDVGGAVTGMDFGILAGSSYEKVVVKTGTGKITGQIHHGISATSSFGEVEVTTGGVVEGRSGIVAYGQGSISISAMDDVFGLQGYGIAAANYGSGEYAGVFGAGGEVRVSALGDVFGSVSGISVFAGDGGANVIVGTGTVTGEFGDGVFLNSTTSSSSLNNDGTIRGHEHGVLSYSSELNFINNNGTIENLSKASDGLAIASGFSATAISNTAMGKILGRIEMGTGGWEGSFSNQGFWQSTGISDFGAGEDFIQNSGIMRFSGIVNQSEVTMFSGLELFENSGLLSGQDQASADGSTDFDTLTLSGDYVGNSGAIFALDAYLGGPGSLADVVTVEGSTSGSTAIQLNNTNSGVSEINLDGILLVDVKGGAAASDFYLADGPISAGLFDYALNFQASAAGNQFLLQSAQSAASHETVVAVDAVQALWQGGAEAWRLHQVALRDDLADGVQIAAVADPVIAETQNSKVLWANFRGDWAQRSTTNAAGVEYNQQTFGLDGGADFVMDAGAHQKIMFGIVAGYQSSQVGFDGSADGIELEGGSLGAHAGLISNGFFADVLMKQDWLALEYTLAGTGKASTKGRTLGVSGDLGYRFGAANSFIEPMVSFASSKTTIGDFVLGSGLVSPDANTNTRVGAGVRVGFTDDTYSLSVAARLWQGLDKGNSVNVSGTGLGFEVSNDGISHGIAGELSGKFAVNLTDASQIFAAGSVQFSEDGNSQSVNGGLQFTW